MIIDLNGKMTAEQWRQVVEALSAKHVRLPCPRCGNPHFTLLEGYFNQPVSGAVSNASSAMAFWHGPTVPSVVTACTNCGFLSQHALGALGLLPPQSQEVAPSSFYGQVGEPTPPSTRKTSISELMKGMSTGRKPVVGQVNEP
jgi:hypothetical protein